MGDHLDFELSAMFNGLDESIKYPQKHKNSYSDSFQISKVTTKHFSKKKQKRKKSQSTLIYKSKDSDPTNPSSSEHNLSSFIIDDHIKNVVHSNNAALKNQMDLIIIGKKKKYKNIKPNHLIMSASNRNKSMSEYLRPRISTTIQSDYSILCSPSPPPNFDINAKL